MSGRITQSYWNQYRVPPVCTSNRTGRVSRSRPRESRDKAIKKSQGKIAQLDIRSAEVKRMDKPLSGFKEFLLCMALILLFLIVFCSLVGAVDKL